MGFADNALKSLEWEPYRQITLIVISWFQSYLFSVLEDREERIKALEATQQDKVLVSFLFHGLLSQISFQQWICETFAWTPVPLIANYFYELNVHLALSMWFNA